MQKFKMNLDGDDASKDVQTTESLDSELSFMKKAEPTMIPVPIHDAQKNIWNYRMVPVEKVSQEEFIDWIITVIPFSRDMLESFFGVTGLSEKSLLSNPIIRESIVKSIKDWHYNRIMFNLGRPHVDPETQKN